jgi:hypothetical protein
MSTSTAALEIFAPLINSSGETRLLFAQALHTMMKSSFCIVRLLQHFFLLTDQTDTPEAQRSEF